MTRERAIVAMLALAAVLAVVWLQLRSHHGPRLLPSVPAPSQPTSAGPTVHLTAAQDHQRILALLHIRALRPGVNGTDLKAADAANYDEARANPYPALPDPLRLANGKPVATADMWWQQRRQEIADTFDREVYGRLLPEAPALTWRLEDTAPEIVGKRRATTRHFVAHLVAPAHPDIVVDIKLTVTLPDKTPAPMILELAGGSAKPESTWREQVLAKGWGAAVLDVTTIQPDDGAGLTDHGIIGLVAKGQPRALNDWGVLRVWAWGASRAMDYFESDPAIDATQVGIAGHSRYGKAALVAMAYDPRFAVAYISSSGAGGAGLLRRNYGERIENLAGVGEYHWFAGNFLKYSGPLTATDLPVDAHELIALCAPRPVFIGAGSNGDSWVDARGMFMAEAAATPVYRLLGKTGLQTTAFPAIGSALTAGELAFRQHEGGHTPEPNWRYFLAFAQRFLHAPGRG